MPQQALVLDGTSTTAWCMVLDGTSSAAWCIVLDGTSSAAWRGKTTKKRGWLP